MLIEKFQTWMILAKILLPSLAVMQLKAMYEFKLLGNTGQDIRTADSKCQLPYQRMLIRSEEHTSELQSRENIVCRLLLEKKNELLYLKQDTTKNITDQ